MHDNPQIYPNLPSRPVDNEWLMRIDHGRWRTCWEYVLTHDLSETEGAAFWHGANLAAAAFTPDTTAAFPATTQEDTDE